MTPIWSGTTGIDPSFLEMMPDTVIFNAATATDKYGKKTFTGSGSNISAQARIMYDVKLIKNDLGQDVVTAGQAYLYGNFSTLTLSHKMTLPNGTSPVILKIDNKNDTSATIHHTVVYFGQ